MGFRCNTKKWVKALGGKVGVIYVSGYMEMVVWGCLGEDRDARGSNNDRWG